MKQNQEVDEYISKFKPCDEALEWCRNNGVTTLADAWDRVPPEWLVWMATREGVLSDRELRLFACWCCRQIWHLMTDERSRNAVETAERYARGEATDDELAAARDALWDAAARSAYDAASDTAWAAAGAAAMDAAWDAARAAAGAAAMDAAWAATCAAARDAPWDAAWYAAVAAAWDVAWDRAWYAAFDAQAEYLRSLGNPFRS